MHKQFSLLSLSLLVSICFSIGVGAQTPAPSPTSTPISAELQELIDQNAILEQRKKAAEAAKAIAEAEKAELAAKFPKASVTPLAGTTMVDANVKIENQMMAYRAMAGNADRVASELRSVPMKSLAIFSFEQVKLLQNYTATREQLGVMLRGYEEALVPKVEIASFPAALSAGTSLVGSVAELLSYFRTDTEIKGQSVTIGESAFAAEIFRALRAPSSGFDADLKLYYPFEFSPKPNGLQAYPIIQKIEDLNRIRQQAGALIFQLDELDQKKLKVETRIKELQSRSKAIPQELIAAKDALQKFEEIYRAYPSAGSLEKVLDARKKASDLSIEAVEVQQETATLSGTLNTINTDIAAVHAEFKNGKSGVAYIKALNAQFDKFYSEITSITATGTSPLGLYLQAEHLRSAMGCAENLTCPQAHLLAIKVIEAGGNNRTKKNLFTTVFTGDNVTHSGGAIVEYRLYDADGVIIRSNTFTNYEYYRKSKSIAKFGEENFRTESKKWFDKQREELEKREAEVKAREAAVKAKEAAASPTNKSGGNQPDS